MNKKAARAGLTQSLFERLVVLVNRPSISKCKKNFHAFNHFSLLFCLHGNSQAFAHLKILASIKAGGTE
jgi:hypothetical protein